MFIKFIGHKNSHFEILVLDNLTFQLNLTNSYSTENSDEIYCSKCKKKRDFENLRAGKRNSMMYLLTSKRTLYISKISMLIL